MRLRVPEGRPRGLRRLRGSDGRFEILDRLLPDETEGLASGGIGDLAALAGGRRHAGQQLDVFRHEIPPR